MNGHMDNNRQGAAEISPFLNNSQKHHTCKTYRTTKDIEEWMKWSFLANYCCEHGHGGAFCASHKQSFFPLSPAIERDTLARRDGWSREEQSGAFAVLQLTSYLVLQTSLMTVCTECDFYFYIYLRSVKIPAYFNFRDFFWLKYSDEIHVWFKFWLHSQ